MRTVRFLEEAVEAERRSAGLWYVTDGLQAIGPVDFDLLVRGVELGRVPLDSYVRHEAWRIWKPLGELAEVLDEPGDARPGPAGKLDVVPRSRSGEAGEKVDEAAPGPSSAGARDALEVDELEGVELEGVELEGVELEGVELELEDADLELIEPTPAPDVELLSLDTDLDADLEPVELADFVEPVEPEPRTERTPSRPPPAADEPLEEEDLLAALGAVARAAGADLALLVEVREEGARVLGVHPDPGAEIERNLFVSPADPVAAAAARGQALVAEPEPGPAGLALESRRRALGLQGGFGAMLPISTSRRWSAAWVELGSSRPLRLSALAEAEALVARLAERLDVARDSASAAA